MLLVSVRSPLKSDCKNGVDGCVFLMDNFTSLELEEALDGLRELQVLGRTKDIFGQKMEGHEGRARKSQDGR